MAQPTRRVLLLRPPNPFLESRSIPQLGLLYLGTTLHQAGHDVVIRHLRRLDELETLAKQPWDLVGISATTREYLDALQTLNYFKRQNHRAIIALGGPHATAMSNEALRNGFDVVMTGEADHQILNLVDTLPSKQTKLKCRPIPNLDELPFPDRSLLDRPGSWRPSLYHGQPPGMRITTMILSRGCPYACRFCGPHDRYRRRSDENIAGELAILRRDGYDGIIFLDDLPFRHEQDIRAFCDMIGPLRIAFRLNSRPDLFTEQIAELLVVSGCRRVQFGIESASQAVLDGIDKGTFPDRNGQAVMACHKLGLEVKVMLVWGLPGDDEATAHKLVSWVSRYRPDSIQVAMLSPVPGSPLWQEGYDKRVTDYRRLTFFRQSSSKEPLGVANDRLSDERLDGLYDWIISECQTLTRIDRGLPYQAAPQEK